MSVCYTVSQINPSSSSISHSLSKTLCSKLPQTTMSYYSTGLEFSISTKLSLLYSNHFSFRGEISKSSTKMPTKINISTKNGGNSRRRRHQSFKAQSSPTQVNNMATTTVEVEQSEVEVAEGYTITQFCDKIIDVFLNEKPQTKDWRKLLVFREEWKKYSETFYKQCKARADAENDSCGMKQKLVLLGRKVKKIDDEIERHSELLKEIEQSPTDINAVVAKRRKDFNEEFFRHLTLLSETYDSLDDRDAISRLGARCLSAICVYDNTVENAETLDAAQAKFDDILNSPSLDAACEKIKSLGKAKELDSSLILLINSAWGAAKESSTMKNEVKDIMYHLYKATKSSLRSIAPKEIKLLKHLLNITDPEERFSALATAFSPGHEKVAKDPNALYTTPMELYKWIKIMLDAYHLNKEESEIREAKQLTLPIVMQRLFILKETIEEEYLQQNTATEDSTPKEL